MEREDKVNKKLKLSKDSAQKKDKERTMMTKEKDLKNEK